MMLCVQISYALYNAVGTLLFVLIVYMYAFNDANLSTPFHHFDSLLGRSYELSAPHIIIVVKLLVHPGVKYRESFGGANLLPHSTLPPSLVSTRGCI